MADVQVVVVGRGRALGWFARAFGGVVAAKDVRATVDEGGDARVIVGVDYRPCDGAAAVEVVKGVGAEGGGAERTGDTGVGGEVEVSCGADGGEEVALQSREIGI